MLLFAAAFLGNTTYVVSILTSSALKHDPGFLSESAPYLIGSGGTVGFDLSQRVHTFTNDGSGLTGKDHSHFVPSLPLSPLGS